MLRSREPGWLCLGPEARRSLWARVTWQNGEAHLVELCAGREGDDAYVSLRRGELSFAALLEVALTACYAVEVAGEDAAESSRSVRPEGE